VDVCRRVSISGGVPAGVSVWSLGRLFGEKLFCCLLDDMWLRMHIARSHAIRRHAISRAYSGALFSCLRCSSSTPPLSPLTSIGRWAVKAGDFDAPFAVQGGVCVVTCHLNAQENSLHRTLSWLFPR